MRQRTRGHQRKSATVTVARVVGVTALVAGSAFAVAQAGAVTSDGEQSATAAKAEKSAAAAEKADFNGDGYADTVSAAPGATVAGQKGAGFITVTYGSAKGTSTTHRQIFSANSEGVPGEPEAGDSFGGDSVARDFDGDGTTDLALSSGENLQVLWGAKGKGLTTGSQIPDTDGSANLIGGDFNGDGNPDLASRGGEGGVQLLYGPFTREGKPAKTGTVSPGHDFDPDSLFAGDVTGDGADDLVTTHSFEEMSENSEFFKGSKDGLVDKPQKLDDAETGVIADVNKDGYGDIVIRTVPGGVVEDLPHDHGTLKVLYGTADGPGKKASTLTQNSAGVPGANEEGDEFGKRLSAGDVNGDGYADIAVGVPGEDIGSGAAGKDTGAVVQLLGSKDGLTGKGAKNWDQTTAGVPGAAEAGDGFGDAVSLQDTDGDGHDDLAVGAPGEDGADASAADAGAVWVLRGTTSGLTADGVVSYGPATLGAPENGSQLGSAFAR